METLRRSSASIIAVVGLILAWQVLVGLLHVPTWLLPAPTAIWSEFVKQSHLLGKHVMATGTGAIGGLAIGAASGALLAILMVHSRLLERILMPLLVIDQSIPKMALAPIFVIWFGTGTVPAVITAFMLSFFPIVANIATAFATIEPELLEVMRSLGASRRDMTVKIGIPRSLPYFFASLKIAVTLAFVGSVIAEIVAGNNGIGNVMLIASSNFNVSLVFAALLVVGIMGVGMYAVFDVFERRMTVWSVRGAVTVQQFGG